MATYGNTFHHSNQLSSWTDSYRVTNASFTLNSDTHIHATATAPPTAPQEHKMAQRNDFTFPYTGTEIAAALAAKAARLLVRSDKLKALDTASLELLQPFEQQSNLGQRVEHEVKGLQESISKLHKEAVPYAKAGKKVFEMDLQDIEHFSLNAEEDAPVRKTRKPRTPKPSQPVESAGGAAG